ncbi:MAG TPA: hypothetical protein VG348_00555 [Acidimicrobiia bacterium]|jgi:hypothetical protein|nr:hypothetical protein [Acidimicrobiia bacterium]
MPSMPGYFVGKGYQFGMLDQQFGGNEEDFLAAYEAALNRLDQPLADLAEEHTDRRSGLLDELKPGDVSHFRKHWLGDWWRGKRVEDVLRAGYREAIRRAQDARKPIESLWICANENRFQVYICEGPRQITVLVFTPPPREGEHEPVDTLTEDEPILVVKVNDEDDRKVNADVEVLVPDDKAPIVVHRLKYRPNQPNE